MLVARDPLTNTFVNAFDYKHMSPEERPNGLLCPGVCFDGTPCTAPVTPAALSSEHKHPYFRGVFNCLCIRLLFERIDA